MYSYLRQSQGQDLHNRLRCPTSAPAHPGSLVIPPTLPGMLSPQDRCNCWSSIKNGLFPDGLIDIFRSWFKVVLSVSLYLTSPLKSATSTFPPTLYLLSLLYFVHRTYYLLMYILLIVYCLPPFIGTQAPWRQGLLFIHPEQFLAHRKCPIHISWINK